MTASHFTLLCLVLLQPLLGWSQKIDAAPPIVLSPQEAVRQGRELVSSLLSQRPEPVTNTGVLRIRDRNRNERELAVVVSIQWMGANTVSAYQAREASGNGTNYALEIIYRPGSSNEYHSAESGTHPNPGTTRKLESNQAMVPFAGSDFWVADLGLEFLHWPVQLLSRKEMRRGQATSVLESINPQSAVEGYSRVVSWIDNDSGGIVHADAYDAAGKILKQFSPTHLQKIEGQYEVQQIEMRNRQTGSRSIIEFNLK